MGDLSIYFLVSKRKIMFKSHIIKSNNRALIPMKILLDLFDKKANNICYTKSIVWVHDALAIQQIFFCYKQIG
jgi:hypothetical protein